ncbi:uncharacterized protein METZ01_LOCUS319723, partial [marine metagenome]
VLAFFTKAKAEQRRRFMLSTSWKDTE